VKYLDRDVSRRVVAADLTPAPLPTEVASIRDQRHTHHRHFGRPPFADDPRAACRQPNVNPDWWYAPEAEERDAVPGRRRSITTEKDADRAKAICRTRCPLQAACRDYAAAAREPFGIWGGLGPEERGCAPPRRRSA
jgi:Transcription factor WhiB